MRLTVQLKPNGDHEVKRHGETKIVKGAKTRE